MDITSIQKTLEQELTEINNLDSLEQLKVKYLGRKGLLAQLTSSIGSLPAEQRAAFGKEVNAFKSRVQQLFNQKLADLEAIEQPKSKQVVDISMPGIAQDLGNSHPITQVIEEICSIFERIGFEIVEGNEIETEFANFTGLNIPLDHPAREAFDTFYLELPSVKEGKYLLRSQTSTVQIRAMSIRKPPIAVVAPGRVYRPDAVDASHSFMFHQIEGFMVDKAISFGHLKGVLEFFVHQVFGKDVSMRFRPHHFPFTEPSAEVDISCIICKAKGCSVCGRKGWLEVLGSGMIHPNVLKTVGYDTKKYTGFAFGMGIERIAMLKYGINDIRLFTENDLRFLKQF
ncbi:MAG: phenylalanine--tRNA ligase subunit alpha [Candidatus Omnitrophica bacterium]|nr:phenylalanine--tRNA ligase subunit alpha [Candidatus Omnitrophota bacterium]